MVFVRLASKQASNKPQAINRLLFSKMKVEKLLHIEDEENRCWQLHILLAQAKPQAIVITQVC